jgi:hypothetical protein
VMARFKQNDESEPSPLQRVQRMTAKPGGKPGGRPPQPGDRFYREYLMANFDDGGTESPRGVKP